MTNGKSVVNGLISICLRPYIVKIVKRFLIRDCTTNGGSM
jgi:hypothetical protein